MPALWTLCREAMGEREQPPFWEGEQLRSISLGRTRGPSLTGLVIDLVLTLWTLPEAAVGHPEGAARTACDCVLDSSWPVLQFIRSI